jgi:D-alanyl-D-alanine carboxypeptidase (penicillin-binding protein 5/6)
MLKKAFLILSISFCLFLPLEARGEGPVVYAKSAILLDGRTGKILFQKDCFKPMPPASTTKILTTILALETGNTEEIVEVSFRAASTGEAALGLVEGDKIRLLELIHGALIRSGNDSCVAIAEEIAPSVEEFVGLMNLKAKTIGALQTDFYNPHGLPHPQHLTTAYDLALITRYALENPTFAEIVKKKYYHVRWQSPRRTQFIKNTNYLLWTYPLATGVKTGTTFKAGKCLVASAEYKGQRVIAVILNAQDRFGEAKRLLEYGLRQLSSG